MVIGKRRRLIAINLNDVSTLGSLLSILALGMMENHTLLALQNYLEAYRYLSLD